MKKRIALLALVAGVASTTALAQNDLYDNGPSNGTSYAWAFNNGAAVSDSFSLSSQSTVNALNFTIWLFPGDVLQSTVIEISSSEFGGTTYFDQEVNVVESGCAENQLGFNVCNASAVFTGVTLNAGAYWLTLQDGVVNDDPVYWDENDGPSSASQNTTGTIPSESFTLLGSSSSGTGTTPEPDSLLLFASGLFGVGALLRRKLL